jgi:hypothetical protein
MPNKWISVFQTKLIFQFSLARLNLTSLLLWYCLLREQAGAELCVGTSSLQAYVNLQKTKTKPKFQLTLTITKPISNFLLSDLLISKSYEKIFILLFIRLLECPYPVFSPSTFP